MVDFAWASVKFWRAPTILFRSFLDPTFTSRCQYRSRNLKKLNIRTPEKITASPPSIWPWIHFDFKWNFFRSLKVDFLNYSPPKTIYCILIFISPYAIQFKITSFNAVGKKTRTLFQQQNLLTKLNSRKQQFNRYINISNRRFFLNKNETDNTKLNFNSGFSHF
jgi:hypothetical protein